MRRGVLLIVLLALVAGCGDSSGAALSADHAERLVLRPADLGRTFVAFADGPQAALDNAGTVRADPTRFGREGGWIARYRRNATRTTRGPLVVESRVDVFKSVAGARSDLAEYRTMLEHQPGTLPHPLAVPRIGDASLGVTFEQPGLLPIRFYRVAWRYRNATASVLVQGWAGKLDAAAAVSLVRKQQARLLRG